MGGEAPANEAPYSIGVAAVDITPDYPIRLNGFGSRRTESEGVTQPIWAKAIAIGTDAEKPLVLVTVDSLGLRLSMVEEVARRLKARAGIERRRLAVTFTHSHTTPKVNGASDTIFSTPIPPEHQAHIDLYTAELTDALEKVALAALADRRAARLEWAVGKVRFAKNRRKPDGPVDHDLPMLVVRSAEGDAIRAIYVSYACHCVTLSNNKISGDWAGFAQAAIQRKHPGCVALVSIGCGSDANPTSGVVGDNVAAAAEHGDEIADEVERLLAGPCQRINGAISATLRHVDLPLKPLPSREELAALAAKDGAAGYNAKYQLSKLDRGEPLQEAIDYPIQTWSFGDSLSMVFLAGEVCADYSLRLKRELDTARVWINGYSNDFCCYVPSERLLVEGGYGGGAEIVYFALPSTLAPGLEEKIIAEVRYQVPRQFHRADAKKQAQLRPTPPADALRAIRVGDEFVVELMAAEPLVASPVAIDFGPDGRLWVAEMTDYSHDVNDKFEQSGNVKVLTDRDADGQFDDATVFAGGLRFPTDVKVWGRGVIVCDAPDVIYLADSDGDGRVDVRKVLLTGFATHNAQARVNSLRWGLDNWLYGSCGLFGGDISSFSGQEIKLGSRDFRFQPETGQFEPVTGKTQQGRARDDRGNWFGCENGTLCKHYPTVDHYLARNPHVLPPTSEVFVPAGADPNRLFPVGKPVLFQLSGVPGRPTSACGLEIYRDELLGSEFRGNAFVAEPVNQLVHRLVLTPRGVTFAGSRGQDESQREFLASTDNWFRPVQVRTGLDGCLWVVDMCRYVIEHPRFIPAETLAEVDPMAGRGAGRIYRVRPRNEPPRPVVRLDQLDTAGLVAALDSPNGPQRDLAQQMLVARGDSAAVLGLEKLAAEAMLAETRLQALCTLAGLDAVREETALSALSDAEAGVRRHAIRISESLVNKSPAVGEAWASLTNDADPQVQLQLAYSLGMWTDARATAALTRLARKHFQEPYLLTAVLSSVNRQNAAQMVQRLLSRANNSALPLQLQDAVITIATKIGDESCFRDAFAAMSRPSGDGLSAAQLIGLANLFDALDAGQRTQLAATADDPRSDLGRVVAAAREVLLESDADGHAKLAAVRILVIAAPGEKNLSRNLGELLGPQSSPGVQQAALNLLVGMRGPQTGETLLANWSSYTPTLRSQVLEVFFGRDDLLPQLVVAVKSGNVKPGYIDATRRQRLLAHANADIRAAAVAAFAGAIDANRQKVIDSYAGVDRLAGNAAHGRELFGKHCASCHRLEEQGSTVGPDLAALTTRTTASLLEAVFDPNRTIDERYHSYLAITDEGQTYTGILENETSTSITLIEQQGKEHTLLRNTLDQLEDSGISLMPVGLEKDLSVADVADLFAYLMAQGRAP